MRGIHEGDHLGVPFTVVSERMRLARVVPDELPLFEDKLPITVEQHEFAGDHPPEDAALVRRSLALIL